MARAKSKKSTSPKATRFRPYVVVTRNMRKIQRNPAKARTLCLTPVYRMIKEHLAMIDNNVNFRISMNAALMIRATIEDIISNIAYNTVLIRDTYHRDPQRTKHMGLTPSMLSAAIVVKHPELRDVSLRNSVNMTEAIDKISTAGLRRFFMYAGAQRINKQDDFFLILRHYINYMVGKISYQLYTFSMSRRKSSKTIKSVDVKNANEALGLKAVAGDGFHYVDSHAKTKTTHVPKVVA